MELSLCNEPGIIEFKLVGIIYVITPLDKNSKFCKAAKLPHRLNKSNRLKVKTPN